MSNQAEPLMTAQEMADHLGIHVNTLHNWSREGKIPTMRTGKLKRFNRAAVEAALFDESSQSAERSPVSQTSG